MDDAVQWLLQGDVSVQYLTHRLLLGSDADTLAALQRRIETEGFGARLLSCRSENGHWGRWFYQPKWTSTHYTLTDLKDIGMPQACAPCCEMVVRAFDECMLPNGGINFAKTMMQSDVCVDGIILAYAAYFCPDEQRIERLASHLLGAAKSDGGYSWDAAAERGDAHTTICVLEGFDAYQKAGFVHRLSDIKGAQRRALEMLFSRALFIGEDARYEKLAFPYRYRYDLLRFLDYCATADVPYDSRMEPAIRWLQSRRTADGRWLLEYAHKGNVHFDMETLRQPSRFITLKALRILCQYAQG
ncbi:MAG: hypothetical protein AAGU77_02580 [Bacillota bacterium]